MPMEKKNSDFNEGTRYVRHKTECVVHEGKLHKKVGLVLPGKSGLGDKYAKIHHGLRCDGTSYAWAKHMCEEIDVYQFINLSKYWLRNPYNGEKQGVVSENTRISAVMSYVVRQWNDRYLQELRQIPSLEELKDLHRKEDEPAYLFTLPAPSNLPPVDTLPERTPPPLVVIKSDKEILIDLLTKFESNDKIEQEVPAKYESGVLPSQEKEVSHQ